MKKIIPIFLSVLLIVCMLTGCNAYKVPENCCIVGLYKDYKLYSKSEGKLCEPIGKAIKGVEKNAYTNYYSVIKDADYTILVDNFVDDSAGFGNGLTDTDFVPAWWQGYIITSFVKTYGEKSGLQDEVFFITDYKQINHNVSVSFTENCTVKATYEPYLYVGGIFEIIQKGSDILDNKIDEYLTEYGILGERDGFYYLLLKDEVCVHQDAWKTNFEVTEYTIYNKSAGCCRKSRIVLIYDLSNLQR